MLYATKNNDGGVQSARNPYEARVHLPIRRTASRLRNQEKRLAGIAAVANKRNERNYRLPIRPSEKGGHNTLQIRLCVWNNTRSTLGQQCPCN